jgi:hypothetical protein
MSGRNPRKRNRIDVQFTWKPRELLESPAFRVLSLSAHRYLSRVELELCLHGGKDNGKLPVTSIDLIKYGIGDRSSIAPARAELEALGLIEITRMGIPGRDNSERYPTLHRLTYHRISHPWQSGYNAGETNEWKKIGSIEEAKRIAAEARRPFLKTVLAVGKTHTNGRETLPKLAKQGWENPTTRARGKTLPLSKSREEYRAEDATQRSARRIVYVAPDADIRVPKESTP